MITRIEINEYTDWIVKNFHPRFPNKGEWLKIGDKTKKIYFTRELFELFENDIRLNTR